MIDTVNGIWKYTINGVECAFVLANKNEITEPHRCVELIRLSKRGYNTAIVFSHESMAEYIERWTSSKKQKGE